MTVLQVAEYLVVNPETIYLLLKNRRIPGLRLGSIWRFRRSDIEQWISDREMKPAGGPGLALTHLHRPGLLEASESEIPFHPYTRARNAIMVVGSHASESDVGESLGCIIGQGRPEPRGSATREKVLTSAGSGLSVPLFTLRAL